MKKIKFYNGIEEIVNNAVKVENAVINHLFFVPDKEGNSDGWCDAHRYGYNNIDGKCYDLGVVETIPKIDYTNFVFDFIPCGIHIAKKDSSLFKVNCELYCDTEIDWYYE